jgi:hypothetical protein
MTRDTRVRVVAEDFVRTLEQCGSSRADAASELAAIAASLAREGNTGRASVLMEVSEALRCDPKNEPSHESDVQAGWRGAIV